MLRKASVLVLLLAACGSPEVAPERGAEDASSTLDGLDAGPSGSDAGGPSDSGARDAAAGLDASAAPDAGARDASSSVDASTPPDASAGADAANHCAEPPPSGRVALPADDSVHSELMEWWYWTGHLQDEQGNWFGFEEVFFLTPVQRMMHVAVTDISQGAFHFVEKTERFTGYPTVPNGYDLAVNGTTAVGGDGHDVLHGVSKDGYGFDLDLVALKRPVLQHGTGYTEYSFGGNTYYYSRERMSATGTLTVNGVPRNVAGSAWFDHQWGNMFTATNLGWDWFALQLDDGREIMLFIVRKSGQVELVGGSYTDAQCNTREVAGANVIATPRGQWRSPHTFCSYPSGWDVTVDGMSFTVTPVVEDQEVYSSIPIYWEGAALVSGSATGRAYVELTGYCP